MDTKKKKILVLTGDAGFGHRSAAIAIVEALKEKYTESVDVELINPLDDKRAPFFLRDSQSDYDKWVRQVPELYKFGYEASDAPVPASIMVSILTVLLYEVMRDLIRKQQPNVVISTYPLYHAPLEAVRNVARVDLPIMTVVTDLASVHHIWFSEDTDITVVPTKTVKDLALQAGLREESIRLLGIPVHPKIAKLSGPKMEYRKELGWREDLTTVLAVGSKRVDHFLEMINLLNYSGFNIQLALVAGKDEELYERLNKNEWQKPSFIYDFVENMPAFMRASDLMVCKAGGLIVTESLASGLPLLLIDVIQGQETGNAKFVEEEGVGFWVKDASQMVKASYHLLSDDQKLLLKYQNKARQVGKPNAAYEIAEVAYNLSQSASQPKKKSFEKRPGILDLLGRNQIDFSG